MDAGVKVIGVVPKGLATFSNFFSVLDGNAISTLVKGAFGIAIISFMQSIAMCTQGG